MTPEISQRIAALRWVLISGLVYVHFGRLPGSDANPFRGVSGWESVIPQLANSATLYLFFSAVPMLSVLSGYLMFQSRPWRAGAAVSKRLSTVLLPSLLWLALWWGVGALLVDAMGVPSERFWAFFQADYDLNHAVIALTGFDLAAVGPLLASDGLKAAYHQAQKLTSVPVAQQFWFIHDLMLTVLLSPLLHRLITRLRWAWGLLLLPLWLYGIVPPGFFRLNVLLFFSVGASIALLGAPPGWRALFRSPLWLWGGILLVLIGIRVVVPAFQAPIGAMPWEHQLECGIRAVGVLCFWRWSHWVWVAHPGLIRQWGRWSTGSFFLFAFHYPSVVLLKGWVASYEISQTVWGQAVCWLLVPLLTIGLAWQLALQLDRWAPTLLLWLNGQRRLGRVPLGRPVTVTSI
ncbi:acyltransferase family protein [Ferrimonas pelagia]|uniref:Acyltransferase 3 domain-containing protein n=1 Tax=Ferrimonas pelagia TaxID=1177826 RepID=A0ABP9EXZ7_9GAMM